MKIIGFAQLRNELIKGNLHSWFKSMEFCDYIYIFDQASDDGSQEIYKQHDNVTVIQSETNRFNQEILCKKQLLEKLLQDHADVDWIFWMDGDTCLDKRLAKRDSLEEFLNRYAHCDGVKLHHLNLWRSNCYARFDNLYNNLQPICFWRNNGQLHFPSLVGLHKSQIPAGIGPVAASNETLEYNLLHYGFTTPYQIIHKYHLYATFGQKGSNLYRLIDERGLNVQLVGDYCLPDFKDASYGCLPDGSYDHTRKSILEIIADDEWRIE
jgi:hypothetical protein